MSYYDRNICENISCVRENIEEAFWRSILWWFNELMIHALVNNECKLLIFNEIYDAVYDITTEYRFRNIPSPIIENKMSIQYKFWKQ